MKIALALILLVLVLGMGIVAVVAMTPIVSADGGEYVRSHSPSWWPFTLFGDELENFPWKYW